MWKIKSHLELDCHQEFETREDALIEMHRIADDLADDMGANVFHDGIGLSTVYDEESHICYWIDRI